MGGTSETALLFNPLKFAEFHNQVPSTNYDVIRRSVCISNVLFFVSKLDDLLLLVNASQEGKSANCRRRCALLISIIFRKLVTNLQPLLMLIWRKCVTDILHLSKHLIENDRCVPQAFVI